jgi:tetratricopeptide (TPR) repeat protein
MSVSDKKNKKNVAKTAVKGNAVNNSIKTYPYLIWCILALVFIVFVPALSNGFVNWDDPKYLLDNSYIKDLSGKGIKAMFSSFYGGNYHPLTALSNAIEFKLFGLNPKPYHFFNIVLHLINTFLVFKVIRLLCSDLRIALTVSLLFGIHPMHVESVAWLSERKDVLYTFFYLIAIIQYIKFQTTNSAKQYLFVFLAFLCSLLSKSAAVVLPVTLLLLDYYFSKKITLTQLINKIPFFILSFIFGFVALRSQAADGAISDLQPYFSFADRLFLALYSVLYYIIKLVVPSGLSAFHAYPDKVDGFFPFYYYVSPLVFGLLFFIIYKAKKFRNELIFGLLFFLVNIALIIQIIPVGQALVAERYSYVPYIGLFFIIATAFFYLEDNYKGYITYIRGAGVVCILFFSVVTFGRTKVWKDSMALWKDVIEKNDKVAFAYYNLGNAYKNVQNFQEAIHAYSGAVKVNPQYVMAYFNRAHAYADIQNHTEAIADYGRVIEKKPQSEEAYYNRGISRATIKDYDLAIVDFTESLKINPKRADAFYSRGNMKAFKNLFAEAMEDYDKAIDIDPKFGLAYNNRGNCKLNLSRMPEACADWRTALQLGNASSEDMIKRYCN